MTRASDTAKLLGAGATILDGTTISTADNTDSLILTSTDADASSGPNLNMFRNSSSPADNDFLGNVKFNGRNDNSQDVQYGELEVYAADVSDGTEDGWLNFNVMTGGSNLSYLQIKGGTGVVFNEDSNDIDFRVESDTKTHALFVQGSDGVVGINKSSPTSGYMLHVGGSSGVHTKVKIEATTATGQAELDLSADPAGVSYLNLGDEDSNNIGYLGYFHSDNSMRFQTNSAEQVRIHSNGVLSASDGIALGVGTANTASNVLDDYEEGLATVSFTSSGASFNYTIRQCTYTKVGRIVHIQIYMQLDGTQTLTGNTVTITGLPFTSSNATSYVTACIAGIRYVSLDTNYTHLQARVATNTTTINLLQNGAGQPGVNLNSNKLSNASGQVFINMSYITA